MRFEASSGGVEGAAPTRAAGRVLVIDDEPMMGTTLRMAMAETHEVVFAPAGEKARELLQQDREFDAIVCDLMMPHVSGMDLHAWLIAVDPALAQRMIFMTGGAYTDDSRRFLETVANPHIQKPFDVDELIDLVDRVREGESSIR
jgi:DNA-binding NtrC family response regulator